MKYHESYKQALVHFYQVHDVVIINEERYVPVRRERDDVLFTFMKMADIGLLEKVDVKTFNEYEQTVLQYRNHNYDKCELYKLTEEGKALALLYEM